MIAYTPSYRDELRRAVEAFAELITRLM